MGDIEVDIEVGEKNVDGGCAVVLFFARALERWRLNTVRKGNRGERQRNREQEGLLG